MEDTWLRETINCDGCIARIYKGEIPVLGEDGTYCSHECLEEAEGKQDEAE